MEFMTPVDKYMISGVHRIRIGSLDENEIVVRSPEMIGVQTEFVENGNGWIICDTGSRSLTVDGNLVQYRIQAQMWRYYRTRCFKDNILCADYRCDYTERLKRQYYCQSAILGFRGA